MGGLRLAPTPNLASMAVAGAVSIAVPGLVSNGVFALKLRHQPKT